MADITFKDHGSIIMVSGRTPQGLEWIQENLLTEEWQRFGNMVAIDHNYADDILDGIVNDGLEVVRE